MSDLFWLTDKQMQRIEPYFPLSHGVPRVDDRRIAARFASQPGFNVLWALSRYDLYAPGLEQVGLAPDRIFHAEARKDADVLALAEDALRFGSFACVVAEVKSADQTATRRLQLAASEGMTPMLLYRRHRARCPLDQPSSAMTRWPASSSLLPCRRGSIRSA